MTTIRFAPMEAEAMAHRLSAWDAIAECFADTDGLEHLAEEVPARACELERQLRERRAVDVDPAHEIDRELMVEAIEGSVWVAVSEADAKHAAKGAAAAYSTLCRCADKVALAFDLLVSEISIPTA